MCYGITVLIVSWTKKGLRVAYAVGRHINRIRIINIFRCSVAIPHHKNMGQSLPNVSFRKIRKP